jgi:predicted ABC-type sugar transport system permease subunit
MLQIHKISTAVFFTLVAFLPIAASALDSSTELRSVITNSVLADPRSAGIPPAQLQGLVDSLVAEATAQHMTVADIVAHPQVLTSDVTFGQGQNVRSAACTSGWQGYLCQFNRVFGFEGNNHTIPLILLVVSAFLLAVIWEMILHRRKAMALKATAPAASAAMTQKASPAPAPKPFAATPKPPPIVH